MTDFQHALPTEIRLMIWKYVGVAEQRVVTVDHSTQPFKRNIHKRKKFVRENPPILLHICQESRQLALSQYGSFFRLPPPQIWNYTGPRTYLAFDAICRYVGVPNYRGSKGEMEQRLTNHVNIHQATSGVVFKKLLNSAHGWGLVPVPQWFDPAVDILLLRLHFGFEFQKVLWQPKQGPEFSKLRKLAMVLERFHSTYYASPAQILRMLMGIHLQQSAAHDQDVQLWHWPELQQISLIVLQNGEVFRIEMDDTGLLKGGQWSYSLAPASDDFKEEMGSSWSGVLWKVTLAKEEGKSLAQAAIRWKPDFRVWECHKMAIYKDDETAFSASWYNSPERIIHYFWAPTPPGKILIEGGDGRTYLGVSIA